MLVNNDNPHFDNVDEENGARVGFGQMSPQPQAHIGNMIHSTEVTNPRKLLIGDKHKDKQFTVYNRESDNDDNNEQIMTHIDILKSRDPENTNENNGIKWDEMFEDILPQVQSISKETPESHNSNIEDTSTSENDFLSDTNICDKGINPNKISIISNEMVTPALLEKIGKKRKSETKNVSVPKKVNKVTSKDIEKPVKRSLRKQKYTKTVKKWLETVDPNNPADEEITMPSAKEDKKDKGKCENAETSSKKTLEVKIEIPRKEATSKRAVQAQLTNKDGLMKFKKPDHKKAQDEVTLETVPNHDNQDASREKKLKTKFVVPIKSQIPVKDIEYEIININKYMLEHLNVADVVDSNVVVIILIYSNGSCQLNSHYTDDSCSVEGIMINIQDTFYYLKHADFPNIDEIRKLLAGMLNNKTIICYEAKNLLSYLATRLHLEYNDFQANIVDVKIGGSLIEPDSPPKNFSELQKVLLFTPSYTVTTDCTLQKAAWYLTLLKECEEKLRSVLCEQALMKVFLEVEMRLVPLIADMERRGVKIDVEKLKTMESLLFNKIKQVEKECYKAAGKTFQINSTVQVRTILYDELKLDIMHNVKIRVTATTGAKSTSETVLRSLMSLHPLPKLILEYRHLHKAHATFLTGIAQHVKEDVVKPTWVQTAAVTGRIASNNPNLQAIPKAPFSLIMFPESGETENQTVNFRSVYVARPGFTLLAADFQHIECRVFAHAAADTALLQILATDQDLFRVLASKWLNKPHDSVSLEERERTKRIVYALLYGAGTGKLTEDLNLSLDQTKLIVDSVNRTFPSLKSFGSSVVARCAASGGRLATLCGRARRFEHIRSADASLRSHAERQAVNFIVQGSAADLCKLAMVESGARLRSAGVEGYLVLQIHDELVWEVRQVHLATARDIVRDVMQNCGRRCGITSTLPVTLAHGQNWAEMHAFD